MFNRTPTIRSTFGRQWATALLALSVMASTATAEIQVQAHYRCGEADTMEKKAGAETASVTRDSSPNGRHLIHVLGTLNYTRHVPKAATGSTVALRISESGTCYSDDVGGFGLEGQKLGWGIEGWFMSSTANEAYDDGTPAEKWFVGIGNPHAQNGMAIAQLGDQFVGILNGVAYVEANPALKVQPGQWVHLALVADADGNARLYVNGDLHTTRNAQPGALVTKDAAHVGVRPGGDGKLKDGAVDELRIFTFEGMFDPRDLLVNQTPDPAEAKTR